MPAAAPCLAVPFNMEETQIDCRVYILQPLENQWPRWAITRTCLGDHSPASADRLIENEQYQEPDEEHRRHPRLIGNFVGFDK